MRTLKLTRQEISQIRAAIKHARQTIAFHDLGEAIEPIFEEWVEMKSTSKPVKPQANTKLDGPRDKISISLLAEHATEMRRHAKIKGVSVGSIVRDAAALWYEQNNHEGTEQ